MTLPIVLALLALQAGTDSLAIQVRQLADSYMVAYFEQHPDEGTQNGVANIRHDRLPDNSPASLARWQAREDTWLATLKRVNPKRIAGRPEWIAYGIMRDAIEGSVATRVCRYELWSVAHTGGGWLSTITSLAALQPVGSDDARAQVLARWRAIPGYIATETANHREGLQHNYTAPRGNVQIALNELDTLLATPVAQSPLYDPARRDSTPGFGRDLGQIISTDHARHARLPRLPRRGVPGARANGDRRLGQPARSTAQRGDSRHDRPRPVSRLDPQDRHCHGRPARADNAPDRTALDAHG
jgi:uncharacterized protein (DUF885 family)